MTSSSYQPTEKAILRDLPVGAAFQFETYGVVFEYRGNGWYQIYGRSETGGPWHEENAECIVYRITSR